jgi:hypothetical protein
VDLSELAAGFKSSFGLALTQRQAATLAADLDHNRNGTIGLDEFLRTVNAKRGKKPAAKPSAKPSAKPLVGSRAAGGPGIVATRQGGDPAAKALEEAWGKILGVVDEDPKVSNILGGGPEGGREGGGCTRGWGAGCLVAPF